MSLRARGAIAVGVLCLSAAALAYVLPAVSIIRRMTEARDELRLSALKVDGAISFTGQAAKEAAAALGVPADRPELTVDGVVLLKPPGRCRLEVSSLEGGKLAAVQAAGKLRLEGNGVPAATIALRQVCALLGMMSSTEGESRTALEKHLRALRIDQEAATSLGRFGGQVTYIIGKGARTPQLWVYKDSFLPARLLLADEEGTGWDVRLLDYSSPATGEWFPRVIEVYQGEERQVRFTALKADPKAAVADKLF